MLALAVVWGLTWFAYLPIWAPAVPGALGGGLAGARAALGPQAAARTAQVATPAARRHREPVAPCCSERVDPRSGGRGRRSSRQDLVDLLAEDTIGVPRQEIEAALADDGSLWDPLPMTLPTYVNKARARRTVRTIELTGINSSGHDQADTTLAQEAAQSAEAAKEPETGQRRVAGA